MIYTTTTTKNTPDIDCRYSKRVRQVDTVSAHRLTPVLAAAKPTRVTLFKLTLKQVLLVHPRATALSARLVPGASTHRALFFRARDEFFLRTRVEINRTR